LAGAIRAPDTLGVGAPRPFTEHFPGRENVRGQGSIRQYNPGAMPATT